MTLQKPKTLVLWKRAISQGIKQMLRERNWLLTVGTLSGVWILFQLLTVSFVGVEGFQAILQEETNLRLEMSANASNEQIVELITSVKQLPYVLRVDRITPAKSYEIMKQKDPELIAFLEEFNFENPFPETVQVRFKHLQNYDSFTAFISKPRWRAVLDPSFTTSASDQEVYIRQILTVTSAVRSALLAFLAVAVVVLLYIVFELIRAKLIRKQEEIIIQRLCGAMHFYILLPFIIEVSILLALAICVSIIFIGVLTYSAPSIITSISSSGTLGQLWERSTHIFSQRIGIILLLQICLIPVIAWFGTWFGTYRVLHTRHLGLHRH